MPDRAATGAVVQHSSLDTAPWTQLPGHSQPKQPINTTGPRVAVATVVLDVCSRGNRGPQGYCTLPGCATDLSRTTPLKLPAINHNCSIKAGTTIRHWWCVHQQMYASAGGTWGGPVAGKGAPAGRAQRWRCRGRGTAARGRGPTRGGTSGTPTATPTPYCGPPAASACPAPAPSSCLPAAHQPITCHGVKEHSLFRDTSSPDSRWKTA